ncbi:MAG: caspase family protein, partial [Myxococcota bacterium]|nr:caspase family protein [Myxococcota bacterium]
MHALLLALLLLAWAPMARAGTVRVGIFVGNDIGFGEDEPLAHAEREARDMAEVFQEMGDLERERTVLLTGRKAPEVRQALFGAEAQIREMSARGDDVQVVFYYSGHASREGLHLQGSLLPMAAVRRWLEASSARVRVAFIDACESGTLARTRGGSPIDVIDVAVDDALTSRGLA